MIRKSLQLKVIALISFLMLLSMAIIIPITVTRQKNDLLQASKNTLSINTDMLNLVIKNIMLSGEAPIAVDTMRSLRQIQEFKTLDIYRSSGERAFQDFETLNFVNSYQNQYYFSETARVEKSSINYPAFQNILNSGRPLTRELEEEQDMEYFFPLRNERACWDCHGSVEVSGPLRGIAHFKISIAEVYSQINQTTLLLSGFLGSVVIIFSILLILTIRKLVLQPLLHIGHTVSQFGSGDMEAQVSIRNNDELGMLAQQINVMFSSVKERLELGKYVSKSTDAMIRKTQKRGIASDLLIASSQKENLVVLFSDIRGFTDFADKAKPDDVVKRLNMLLDIQTQVIEKYVGDIDKFMGDAIMALFQDTENAVRAAKEMVKQTYLLSKDWDHPLNIGIGIHCGELITGNIGSQNRLEYAVIGDTVNLASRLCSLAPQNTIFVSESVYQRSKEILVVKKLENKKIRGKAEPITYYAVKKIHDADKNVQT